MTDEHHAPTVLAVHGLGDEVTCVSNIVHVLWKPSDTRSPYRYQPRDVTRGTLEKIRARGKNCRPELTIECVHFHGTHDGSDRSDRGTDAAALMLTDTYCRINCNMSCKHECRTKHKSVSRRVGDQSAAAGLCQFVQVSRAPCRAAEREGNFVSTLALGQFSCPALGDAFVQPFELDWPPAVGRNLNCSVFSRKWSVAASSQLFGLLQEIGVLPEEAVA